MQASFSPSQLSVLFAALFTPLALTMLADPPPPNAASAQTLHAEARVVQVDVVVTDAHGKPVADLAKQDFSIMDDGKPRIIDIFSINGGEASRDQSTPAVIPLSATKSEQPRPADVFSNRNPSPPDNPGHSTVIVLDQVNAFVEDAAYARDQVTSLLKKLKLDERIALYVIARKEGLVLLQDYTTDRALLLKSLSIYTPRALFPSPPPSGSQANKSGNASPVGETLAQANAWAKGADQPWPPGLPPGRLGPEEKLAQWQENSASARLSLQALAEHLALMPGRKGIYWVTQAFPPWLIKEVGMWTPPAMNTAAWNKTITALNEANVAVNTVDARGIFRGGNPNTGTLDTMQEIAGRTGGKAYIRRNDLDTAMEEGIEASRTTYTLGFYLTPADRDESFHALKVQAARPGVQLFYRQGYYAGDTDMPDSSKDKPRGGYLESVLLSQANSPGVGITARVDAMRGSPQGKIDIHLNLDLATLLLKQQGDSWTGKVDEMFVELDESGATLAKVSDVKEFEFAATERARYETQGLAWQMAIPLVEGAKKLTIVVRDTASGNIGSLSVPLAERVPGS